MPLDKSDIFKLNKWFGDKGIRLSCPACEQNS